jgi:hypothetical protein
MSSTNRRFIVAYILLVGAPLAALVGVLKVGRNLTAPLSIDGVWTVSADTSNRATDPCGKAASSLLDSPIIVSQSGKSLEITFREGSNSAVPAELDGTAIKASLRTSGCTNDQFVNLVASVDSKSISRTLTGSLTVANCASCAPLQFHAVRESKSQSGAAR